MKKKANRFKKAVDSAVLNTEKSMAGGAGNAPENIAEAAGIAGGNEAENDSRMSVGSRKMAGGEAVFAEREKTEGSRKMAGAQAFSQSEKTEGSRKMAGAQAFSQGEKTEGSRKIAGAQAFSQSEKTEGSRKMAGAQVFSQGEKTEGSRKMAGAQAFSQGEKTEKDMAFETDAAGLSDIVLEYRFESGKKADGGKKSPVSRRKTQLSAAENILETVMKAGRRKGANHTIYLSGDVAEALAAHAKGMKTTKSALVNEILREVLVR